MCSSLVAVRKMQNKINSKDGRGIQAPSLRIQFTKEGNCRSNRGSSYEGKNIDKLFTLCCITDGKQRGLLMLYCLAHFSFIWYRTQVFRLVFKFKVDHQPKQNFSGITFTDMLRILSPEWFYSVPSSLQSVLTSTSSPFAKLNMMLWTFNSRSLYDCKWAPCEWCFKLYWQLKIHSACYPAQL